MPGDRLTRAEVRRIAEIAVARQLRSMGARHLAAIDRAAYVKTTRKVMRLYGVGFWAGVFDQAGWRAPSTKKRRQPMRNRTDTS